MRIGALGWLRVRGADGSEVDLGGALERRVLTALVVRAGHVVSLDMLAEAVFGTAVPANATIRLQNHVSRLRKRLGAGAIDTVAPGYRLEVGAHALDWRHFEQLVIAATDLMPTEPARAAETLEFALGLWRGRPFGDLEEWEPARALAVRLEELHRVAEEELAGAVVATGRAATVVGTLETLVADEPLRERRWMLLMTALQRTGRQAEALRTFQRARHNLDELGLQPGPDLVALERAIAVHDESLRIDPDERPTAPRHNLPAAATRFVGRSAELAEISGLLADHRLVTLTGVGGAGKTRLAVESAALVCPRYSDGVWLVELAPLADGPAVPFALAAALGIGRRAEDEPIESALCGHLAGRRTLLVIDNCEHLIEPAAALVDLLLATCPTVNVLATSRERLGVSAEVVWDVPPMSLPASRDVGDVRASDAAALFVERAHAARRDFQLTERNAAVVANICSRLDGIALALELAASRVHSLGIADIDRHLDDCVGGPGPRSATPRQRTLRATLDWSYELLSSAERSALRRFAVFQATFDLDAAVAILDDGLVGGVEIVGGLVDKSLVVHARAGPYPRYRLLEPVRQYAAERLAEAGETELVERRHIDVFLSRARATQEACLGGLTLGDVHADAPDFRVAMERSWRDHEVDAALNLLLAHFLDYIFVKDRCGGVTLERLLADPGQVDLRNRAFGLISLAFNARNASPPEPHRVEDLASEAVAAARASGDLNTIATCEFSYAELKMAVGDVTAASALLASARDGCARLGSDAGVGWCEYQLGWMAIGGAGPAAAAAHFARAVELGQADTAGAPMLVDNALAALAPVTALLGDGPLAIHQANEAVDSARGLGVPGSILMALLRGAETNVLTDHVEDARDFVRELLHEMRDLGTSRWAADALETAAIILERSRDTPAAAEALAAATALRDSAGEQRGGMRAIAPEVERSRLRLLTDLGPERLATLDTCGRSRSVPAALDAARAALGA
ncbi:MAG: BTAD domain-containing putative transcriptional regulator [Ilumatobacteraceae bacterium]